MSYLASEYKAFSGKHDLCGLAVGRVDTEPFLSGLSVSLGWLARIQTAGPHTQSLTQL